MPTNNLAALAGLGAPPGSSGASGGPPDPWGGAAAAPSSAAPGTEFILLLIFYIQYCTPIKCTYKAKVLFKHKINFV